MKKYFQNCADALGGTFLVPAALLALSAALFRLAPHPANFAPAGALALFLGARLTRRQGMILTLGMLFLSDLLIGFYDWRLMAVVYAASLGGVLLGGHLRAAAPPRRAALFAAAYSSVFYITTNFAVWAFSPWYAHTWSGLMECYALALPFFRNSFLGDVFFSVILFGAYEWVRKRGPDLAAALPSVPHAKSNS